jgi:hypothetical protein
MLLTTKVGAAIATTAAMSFVAGATFHPTTPPTDDRGAIVQTASTRAAKQDRLDLDMRADRRRMACLSQDWLRLSGDCIELFRVAAQAPAETRMTTIVVRDGPQSSAAIRVPRPEGDLTFR